MTKTLLALAILILPPCFAFSQLNIAAGTRFITAGDMHVVLADIDFMNAGTLDATGSTFHFTGTSNNSITDKNNLTFTNITLSKAAGKQISLHAMLNIYGQFHFISGNLDLTDKTIHLADKGSFAGESETSRAFSSNDGHISAYAVLNAPVNANIGNLGAIITSGANMDTVFVTRSHNTEPVAGAGTRSILRAFEFNSAINHNLNATLGIKYFDAELNGLNKAALTQFQRGNNLLFEDMNYSSRNDSMNFVAKSGYARLDKFTLGNAGTLLLASPAGVTAQCKSSYIQLTWKPDQQLNIDHFDVQRSLDEIVWEKLGSVKPVDVSALMQPYEYNDNTLHTASALYRVLQYDKNGKVTCLKTVKAGCGGLAEFKVLPNPVSTTATVVIRSNGTGNVKLQLLNTNGQQVWQQEVRLAAGINEYGINCAALPPGTYALIYTQGGVVTQTIKLMKQ